MSGHVRPPSAIRPRVAAANSVLHREIGLGLVEDLDVVALGVLQESSHGGKSDAGPSTYERREVVFGKLLAAVCASLESFDVGEEAGERVVRRVGFGTPGELVLLTMNSFVRMGRVASDPTNAIGGSWV
jgi:hypothetical protein